MSNIAPYSKLRALIQLTHCFLVGEVINAISLFVALPKSQIVLKSSLGCKFPTNAQAKSYSNGTTSVKISAARFFTTKLTIDCILFSTLNCDEKLSNIYLIRKSLFISIAASTISTTFIATRSLKLQIRLNITDHCLIIASIIGIQRTYDIGGNCFNFK